MDVYEDLCFFFGRVSFSPSLSSESSAALASPPSSSSSSDSKSASERASCSCACAGEGQHLQDVVYSRKRSVVWIGKRDARLTEILDSTRP